MNDAANNRFIFEFLNEYFYCAFTYISTIINPELNTPKYNLIMKTQQYLI